MGVYVHLSICPEGIEPTAWKDFYRQAREFFTGHPYGLCGLRRERIKGTSRLVYSRQLEHEPDDPAQRHLRISGDLASMTNAESFCLYEDIGHYRTSSQPDDCTDFLHSVIEGDHGVAVFSEKTQGRPYHLAVLAVAILAERLFPGRALVSGDINLDQCREAMAALEEQCGICVPLPLLVDVDRLYAALVAPAPSLEAIVGYVYAAGANPEDRIRVLQRHLPRETLLDWLASQLGEYEGAVTLGVIRSFRDWVNAVGDLEGLIDAACFRSGGPKLAPDQLASALVSTGVTLDSQRLDGLDRLDRPAATPDSVYSQFGNAMLDMMGASARNCRYRLGVAAVVACLRERFPDQGDACRELIERKTVALVQQLGDLGAWATRTRDHADSDAETGDGESFVRHLSGDPLSPGQELVLDTFGARLGPVWAVWQSGLVERVGNAVEARHRLLLRAAEHRSLALTENGWAWIDVERDVEILDLLLLLISEHDNAEIFVNVRRGLLEHRDLCDALRKRIACG